MKKWMLMLLAVVTLTAGAAKLEPMKKENVTVVPTVLKVEQGKVNVTIEGVIPAKYMKKKVVKSNVDGMIGKRGIILTGCDSLTAGEITINGVTWTAMPANDEDVFQEGEVASVAAIEGNKLLINKVRGKSDKA